MIGFYGKVSILNGKVPTCSSIQQKVDTFLWNRWGVWDGVRNLRHTYATYLVIKGVPINVVKDLVGRTNVSTTIIYLHATEDIKKEAASKMNVALELIEGGKNGASKC